jgi:hypothetical protein
MNKDTKLVSMTMEEVRKRKPSEAETERLKQLAEMPDEQIDITDLPDVNCLTGGIRGRFYRHGSAQMAASELPTQN